MWGNAVHTDERGISEIYGTVLVISLSFFIAILIVGMGYFVVDGFSSDTEESLAQDSMQVMNERITDVTGSSVDVTSEFTIPASADGIDASAEDGVVRVTVESALKDDDVPELLQAESESYTEEITLGTVFYEGTDDTYTVWQGGGLWTYDQGTTSISSPPELNYDGTSLNLGFTSLTETGDLRAGDTVTIQSASDASLEVSAGIEDEMRTFWTVEPNDQVLGYAPIDVTLEIESEFAEAWQEYAVEGMDEKPDDVELDGDTVVLEFSNVGFDLDRQTSPDDFPEDDDWDIFYAGSSDAAPLNDVISPTEDGGFKVNHDEAITDSDPLSEDDEVFVGYYTDEEENEKLVYTIDGDEDWHPPGQFDENRVSVTETEWDGDSYDFGAEEFICVFGVDAPGQSSQGYEGTINPGGEDSLKSTCLNASTDLNFEELDHDAKLTIEDIEIDDGEPIEPGEELDVTATVTNTGVNPPDEDESIVMKVQTGDDSYTVVDSTPVDDDQHGDETVEYRFEWEPSTSDHADIADGVGNSTEMQIETGADTNTTTVEVTLPSDFQVETVEPRFEVDGTEETFVANATVENTGDLTDTQTVSMWELDDDNYLTMTSTELELEGGENESVELEYDLGEVEDVSDFTVAVTTEDDEYRLEEFVDPPEFEVEIKDESDLELDEEDGWINLVINVTNTGDLPSTKSVDIGFDDDDIYHDVADSTNSWGQDDEWSPFMDVEAGESRIATANVSPQEVWTEDVNVSVHTDDDKHEEPLDIDGSEFVVSELEFEDQDHKVTATVKNTGFAWDNQSVELSVKDETIAEKSTGILTGGAHDDITFDMTENLDGFVDSVDLSDLVDDGNIADDGEEYSLTVESDDNEAETGVEVGFSEGDTTDNWNEVGKEDTHDVSDTSFIKVNIKGAGGGGGNDGSGDSKDWDGGDGGYITAILDVSDIDELTVCVGEGGEGASKDGDGADGGSGCEINGGDGSDYGGGGGGLTYIQDDDENYLAAAGGGGGGGEEGRWHGYGGGGGAAGGDGGEGYDGDWRPGSGDSGDEADGSPDLDDIGGDGGDYNGSPGDGDADVNNDVVIGEPTTKTGGGNSGGEYAEPAHDGADGKVIITELKIDFEDT